MHRFFQAAVVVVAVLMLTQAEAAIYPLGKSKQSFPDWPDKLKDVANDPARYDGSASLGRFDFSYEGEAKDIQRVLDLYAKLDDPHIYLTVEVGNPPAELQVLQFGGPSHSLTISFGDSLKLEDLKFPPKLRIEARPAGSESLDPERAARERDLGAEIQKLVEEHNANLPPAEDADKDC